MPQQAQEGAKKTYDLSASRATIGIPNANAQKIYSALVGEHKLIDSHLSHTQADVKRKRRSL